MSEVGLKVILVILMVSAGIGALASLPVILVRVAGTGSVGRWLLGLHAVKRFTRWLGYNQFYDSAFAEMAHDQAYWDEVRRLTREFDGSDWEAFKSGEKEVLQGSASGL